MVAVDLMARQRVLVAQVVVRSAHQKGAGEAQVVQAELLAVGRMVEAGWGLILRLLFSEDH